MDITFSTPGALIGLAIAIFLIIKKVHPAYSLIFGALIGGLIGGGGLVDKVNTMISGAGVFVDISVITVAPIALAIGERAGLSRSGVLLAMIGGGKAGNIISPNPNTIALSEGFNVSLTSLMIKNIVPALCALVVTIILSTYLTKKKGDAITAKDLDGNDSDSNLPAFWKAIAGPLVVIVLLALRPIAGITIDPLIALPLGGFTSVIITGNTHNTFHIMEFGLSKVVGVAILLIGTGTIAGIIKASSLQTDVTNLLTFMHMPAFLLAPISGILMAAATASTTAGATVAAQTFAPVLLKAGIPALSTAAMIHPGATVIDSLPHGSFFHATGGSVYMSINERAKLIPYEAMIGLTSTVAATVIYLLGF